MSMGVHARQALQQPIGMTPKRVVVVAAFLAVGGGLLIVLPASPPSDLILMQSNSDASGNHLMMAELYLLTARRMVGIMLVLVASLLVAGVIGAWLDRRAG